MGSLHELGAKFSLAAAAAAAAWAIQLRALPRDPEHSLLEAVAGCVLLPRLPKALPTAHFLP